MYIDGLRLVVAAGLIFHKLLWELLRGKARGARKQSPRPSTDASIFIKAVKAAVFVFLLAQTLFLDLFPIREESAALASAGAVVFFVGLALAIVGRLQLGKNWLDLEDAAVRSDQSLVTRGVYAYVRHPIYAGDILLLFGLELALNSWLVVAVIIPLVIVIRQVLAEEALLIHAFPGYVSYCARTKRFIPFLI
jgi:protein-S-isoprenylcysteine O-methyltransferase Ste14